MSVKLRVTRENIRQAKRLKKKVQNEHSFDAPCFCPVALAAKRKFRHRAQVGGGNNISVTRDNRDITYRGATAEDQDLIDRLITNFDSGNYDECQPISVVLTT